MARGACAAFHRGASQEWLNRQFSQLWPTGEARLMTVGVEVMGVRRSGEALPACCRPRPQWRAWCRRQSSIGPCDAVRRLSPPAGPASGATRGRERVGAPWRIIALLFHTGTATVDRQSAATQPHACNRRAACSLRHSPVTAAAPRATRREAGSRQRPLPGRLYPSADLRGPESQRLGEGLRS